MVKSTPTDMASGGAPFVRLSSVSVRMPIFQASQHHSLKRKLLSVTTGGRLDVQRSRPPEVIALDNIDLTIEAGQRIGLTGHNGAGKTTLLRVIAGIFQPTSGTVEVGGKISLMIQPNMGMTPEITGIEFIHAQSRIAGATPRQIDDAIDDIIEFSELGDFIRFPIYTYSTGMQTRLGFSVATAYHAEIVLLDEGLGTGDPAFQEKAAKRFETWLEQASIVVLASHSQEMIKRYCTTTVELEHGRIVSPAP